MRLAHQYQTSFNVVRRTTAQNAPNYSSPMLRTIARVPLTDDEAAILAGRPAGMAASSWVAELARADLAHNTKAPVRPPGLSRTATDAFVSVSLSPDLAAAIVARRQNLPLTDYLRGLLLKEGARPGESLPLPRPSSRQKTADITPTVRTTRAQAPGTVVELPHRDRSFAELEALHRELEAAGYEADPPLLAVRRFDADGVSALRGSSLGNFPGETLRFVVGIELPSAELHPMSEGAANRAWEAIVDAIQRTQPFCTVELTPTVFWVQEGEDGVDAWSGEGTPEAVLYVYMRWR